MSMMGSRSIMNGRYVALKLYVGFSSVSDKLWLILAKEKMAEEAN